MIIINFTFNNGSFNKNYHINRSNSYYKEQRKDPLGNSLLDLPEFNEYRTKIEAEIKKLDSIIKQGKYTYENSYSNNLKKSVQKLEEEIKRCDKFIYHYQNNTNMLYVDHAKKLKSSIQEFLLRYDKFTKDNK